MSGPPPLRPGVARLTCPDCGRTWGPVGVQPVRPGATQGFFRCGACGAPQARVVAGAAEGLACGRCGASALEPLSGCPFCGSARARWG